MLSALDVGHYFLATQPEDAGEAISNLKLQKLCYYAQGFYLALNDGIPLFKDGIEAWAHGPVIPQLYHIFKGYRDGPIPIPEGVDIAGYPEDVRALLDDISDVYGQFSAWKLRNMTHDEPPWRDAYRKMEGSEISRDAMCEYFATQIA